MFSSLLFYLVTQVCALTFLAQPAAIDRNTSAPKIRCSLEILKNIIIHRWDVFIIIYRCIIFPHSNPFSVTWLTAQLEQYQSES